MTTWTPAEYEWAAALIRSRVLPAPATCSCLRDAVVQENGEPKCRGCSKRYLARNPPYNNSVNRAARIVVDVERAATGRDGFVLSVEECAP